MGDGPHQLVGAWTPPNGGAHQAQVGSASCSWVRAPTNCWGPNVGGMGPPNGGDPCSSSGLCFLFMGDGLPPIVGGMGPTKWWGPMQLKWALLPVHGRWAPPIGGGQWRSQYEARGGNYLLLNCLIDNDFTSCVA